MRHILDTAKPRHTQPKWLAVSALFALAALSLAAMRVSARPTETKPRIDNGVTTTTVYGTSSPRSISEDQADKHSGAVERQGAALPAATALDNANPVVTLDGVLWGKAVDGLEPGILLTTPGSPKNRRAPFNSRVEYRVFVRNATGQERDFELQCHNSDEQAPYLIPRDELRNALGSRSIPQRFRALGVTDLSIVQGAYDVKLAPGETAVVPGDLGLYIGDADKQSFPRIETIKAGMNWIVQPIKIRLLTTAEKAEARLIISSPYSDKKTVTTIDRNGKNGQSPVALIGAQAGGKPIYARAPLEVGRIGTRPSPGSHKR